MLAQGGGGGKSKAPKNWVSQSIQDAIQSAVGGISEIGGAGTADYFRPVVEPTSGNPDDDYVGSPYGYGGVGGGYGYGGGGGGGGSTGPSDEQKKAAGNLGAIVGYNADTIKDNYGDMMKVYDVADEQNEAARDNNILVARQNAGSDWFRQHLKLQRTASALNDRSGNAMRGSYLYDYRDLLDTADDMIDSETLDTQRENVNSALMSYFESAAQNVVNRNEAAADVEKGLRELYADYMAQLNNIHPDLATGIDAANHNLKASDWLSTDFFDSHRTEAAKPERQSLYRPDRANHTAREQGLLGGNYNTASSAVRSYWDRMNRGYDQRERQA